MPTLNGLQNNMILTIVLAYITALLFLLAVVQAFTFSNRRYDGDNTNGMRWTFAMTVALALLAFSITVRVATL